VYKIHASHHPMLLHVKFIKVYYHLLSFNWLAWDCSLYFHKLWQ